MSGRASQVTQVTAVTTGYIEVTSKLHQSYCMHKQHHMHASLVTEVTAVTTGYIEVTSKLHQSYCM